MNLELGALTALGRPQALAAIATAVLAGWVTVATTTQFTDSTTRFVGFGLVIFALALILGSRFAIGGAVLVALVGAVIEIGTVPVQRWERSLAIACLWYLAAELAWDSMERRDGRQRSVAVDLERVRELATVIVATLVVTVVAAALVDAAPPRTLVVLAVTVGVMATGLVVATRHLLSTGVSDDSPEVGDAAPGQSKPSSNEPSSP